MNFKSRDALPKPGTILILNGASSSGKTTIARGLQSFHFQSYHHLQLDSFRKMEPPDHWKDWRQQGSEVVDLKLAALCRAMNSALKEYSRHGQNVIFDTELSSRDAWRYLLDDLADLPVLFVGVTCSQAELSERERRRGNRQIGLAASQLDRIHEHKEYDFMVDTTALDANECVAAVGDWLCQSPVPQAFSKMVASLAATYK
jgi:chloramphenicol 3-O phosphotransferase